MKHLFITLLLALPFLAMSQTKSQRIETVKRQIDTLMAKRSDHENNVDKWALVISRNTDTTTAVKVHIEREYNWAKTALSTTVKAIDSLIGVLKKEEAP